MQANCPQCGQPVAVDDARAPDKPFGVKCPRCQTVVRFPGRGTGALPAIGAAPAPTPAAAPASEESRPPAAAPPRREASPEAGQSGRALVALPDAGVAAAAAATLGRLGFAAETIDDWESGAHLLEQGVFAVVVTARVAGAAGKGESLFQRINRLAPEARRRLFLVLVGDEFKSGDGAQAFVSLADLVLASREAGSADASLRATMAERQRLYQAFHDARRRQEAAN